MPHKFLVMAALAATLAFPSAALARGHGWGGHGGHRGGFHHGGGFRGGWGHHRGCRVWIGPFHDRCRIWW